MHDEETSSGSGEIDPGGGTGGIAGTTPGAGGSAGATPGVGGSTGTIPGTGGLGGGLTLADEAHHGSMLQVIAHAGELGIDVPVAFSEPICLVDDATVAGTTHVRDIDDIACGLSEGDRLAFVRDPDNPYDPNAIEVHAPDGARVGFVPCDLNPIPARLMDAGKLLYGEVTDVELRHAWWRIQMRVLMED